MKSLCIHLAGTAAAALLLCTGVGDAHAAILAVELRANAEVGAGAARLDEIARVESEDAGLARDAGRLLVLRDLRAGARQQASRAQVARLIEAYLPRARGQLLMSGSEQIIVGRSAVPLEAEAVIEVARQFLSESHAPQYEQFSAVPVGSLPRMQVPADHVLAHPHLAAGAALARRTSVWVDVMSAEGLYQSIPVWFEVHAEKRVLVLDQGAAKGAGITASAARLRKRDVLALDGRPLDGQSLATGLVAARAIAPGAVLTERSATPPGAVLRGQDLLVRMRMGEVVLEYTCKAPNDAKVGQMMRVTNPASRESFWVRVVGPGLAEAI